MAAEISVRELRNQTASVIGRVTAGERLVLTVNRRPVADIVPHERSRSPWVRSERLRDIVETAGADPGLLRDLAEVRAAVIEG